ncbi:MAG: hypothetical protein BMS9Abin28_2425 [Anaerolineae bacterium]|nr:MAG: hypothetical protein BMS9Abin28_2425 [Anaerolineae bacterium]
MVCKVKSLSDLFQVLADPTRLQIVELLNSECRSVSALVKATGRSQPLVSHHLRILRICGLVEGERRGAMTYYRLTDDSVWEAVERCRQLVIASETEASRIAV